MRRFFFSAGFFLTCVCAASAQNAVSGRVAETMDSGGYTYVRVARGKDSTWVATFKQAVKVGDDVSFAAGTVMTDFHSKSLKRTFKKIIFSEGPAAAGKGPLCPTEKSASKPGQAVQAYPRSARAEGPDAFTVAEVYSRRKELAGKPVSVRGRVVKVSFEILDRNWVHLQDGSGEAKAGTHDLLVTTSGDAKVGETVTARGTAAVDKDFGAGYRYAVLLEKTALKR
ncbi:MAG: DNA-binding protein [Elusimicrobia bacterium]|nr:DNA-binding protein [Elusimicrobiota bacterium]